MYEEENGTFENSLKGDKGGRAEEIKKKGCREREMERKGFQ